MLLALLLALALTDAPPAAGQDADAAEAPAADPAPEPVAPPPAVVLVLPFALEGKAPAFRGVAVAEVLIDELAQASRDSFYTLLQLEAVLRRRDLPIDDARVPALGPELAGLLGASDVLTGTVKSVGDRIEIDATRTRAGQPALQAHLEGASAALPVLGRQVLQKLMGVSSRLPPMARSAQALELGAECAALAGAQPLGPRGRAFSLPAPQVAQLDQTCRAALELDPALGLARAGVSIAASLRGGGPPAAVQLGRFVPLQALAGQFAARRSGRPAVARSLLQDVVAAHPGFLQALGYLGEERLEARDDQAALVAFDAYLSRAPGQPWAMAQKAHALSRLGRKEEAIALTRAALARAPGDPELTIELASRLIDGGNDAGAEPLLRAALSASPPRPLAALRLGYLSLRRKQADEAARLFQLAADTARRPDEAGARAIAHADLARVAASRNDVPGTLRELATARAEGLTRMPCAEPDFQRLKAKPGMAQACAAPPQASAVATESDMSVPVDL